MRISEFAYRASDSTSFHNINAMRNQSSVIHKIMHITKNNMSNEMNLINISNSLHIVVTVDINSMTIRIHPSTVPITSS